MITVDPSFYRWIVRLSKDENFQACIALSDQALEKQYDLELVTRFLTLRTLRVDELRRIGELGDFLTNQSVKFAEDTKFNRRGQEQIFRSVFAMLAEQLSDSSFRRFDHAKGRHLGGFLISAFEVLAIGLSFYVEDSGNKLAHADLARIAAALWKDKDFTDSTGSGIRASTRIPKVIPYAREFIGKWLSEPKPS